MRLRQTSSLGLWLVLGITPFILGVAAGNVDSSAPVPPPASDPPQECLAPNPAAGVVPASMGGTLGELARIVPKVEEKRSVRDVCDDFGLKYSMDTFGKYFEGGDWSDVYDDAGDLHPHVAQAMLSDKAKPKATWRERARQGSATASAMLLVNNPNPVVRRFALDLSTEDTFKVFLKRFDAREVQADRYFSELDISKVSYPPSVSQAFERVLNENSTRYGYANRSTDKKFDAANGAVIPLCISYGSLNCPRYFSALLDYAKPKFVGVQLSPVPLVREICTDPVYLKASVLLARRIQAKVREADAGKAVTGDFFSDARESFVAAGVPGARADDYAWNLCGLYGARGASMKALDIFAVKENAPLFAALRYSFGALGYLDSRAEAAGRSYSLPPNIKTTCRFGRPYHFWNAAYLSHWLLKKDPSDPRSAELAVFLSAVGYQYASPTSGHGAREGFRGEWNSTDNNNTRVSLAMNAAGALFGSASSTGAGTTRKYDVDNAIQTMFREARPLPDSDRALTETWISANPLAAYWKWKSVIAPDQAIKSLRE